MNSSRQEEVSKRTVQPRTRLVYTKPGEPIDVMMEHGPPRGHRTVASPKRNVDKLSSGKSKTSSNEQKKLIEVDAQQQINNVVAEIEDQFDEQTDVVRGIQRNIEMLETQIQEISSVEPGELSDEQAEQWKKIRVRLNEARIEEKYATERLTTLKNRLERKKNEITRNMELELQKVTIQNEIDDEQDIGASDEDIASSWKLPLAKSPKENVQEWVDNIPPKAEPVNFTPLQKERIPPTGNKKLFRQTADFTGGAPEDSSENESSGRSGSSSSRSSRRNRDDGMNQMMSLMQQHLKLMEKGRDQKEVIVKSAVDKKLPVFDGNPGDWNNFKSAYDRSTKKYHFDDSENMSRLHAALKGSARAAVEHLMANTNNMKMLWETLEKRFGRPELILDFLVEKLKECKSPEIAKPDTIVAFGTAIDTLMANVCSFDRKEYIMNKHLVMELVKKLPTLMKSQWFMWLAKDPEKTTNLETFQDWLKPYVEGAVLQLIPEVKSEQKQEEKKTDTRRRGPGAVNVNSGDGSGDKNVCPDCNKKGHDLDVCWKFQKKNLDERWNVVKDKKRCFVCLKGRHRKSDCGDSKPCGVDGCTEQHHTLLHFTSKKKKDGIVKQDSQNQSANSQQDSTDGATSVKDGQVPDGNQPAGSVGVTILEGADGPLAIVPVKIRGPKCTIKTYALLDTGASHTLMEQNLANELGLQGRNLCYEFYGANGHLVRNEEAQEVNCEVSGDFRGAPYFSLKEVYTIKKTGIRPYSINVEELKRKWPHLRRVKGASLIQAQPKLIIGCDHGRLIAAREILESTGDTPVATRCKLGWVVSGRINGDTREGTSYNISGVVNPEDELHNAVKNFFTTENFGVVCKPNRNSKEDERALAILNNTSKKTGNEWEVGLLWAEGEIKFPDSRTEALKRLLGIENRMKKDADFAMSYQGKIDEYLQKGYIRKLSKEEAKEEGPRTYYIPHFAVYNPNKPGKVRLVFDAASKAKGVSLNDKVLKGPDLIRPLTSVLMNFRRHRVVIAGDIGDMFHRVNLRKEDRSSQRFLWRNGNSTELPDVYEMKVLIFGAASSPATAIYIKNRNTEGYEDDYLEAVTAIKDDMYVDDCLTGGETSSDVINLRKNITDICAKGNFEVGKWTSNSPEVVRSIPQHLRADGVKDFEEKSTLPNERVLGMWWDPESDTFSFKCRFNKVNQDLLYGRRPTKRELCRVVMSVYDPLGLVTHYKIQGIIILQETWRTGCGWDDEVTDNLYEKWKVWLSHLQSIVDVKVKRCYCDWLLEADTIELHVFCDASEEAFAAVCYLRFVKGGKIEVNFLLGKARVAPIKKLSIPRLELQAAVLGVRMAKTIQEELRIEIRKNTFWSDSQTVLAWIRSETGRFKEFVGNRIGEIQEESNVRDWRWVPTDYNVADIATRLSKTPEFEPTSLWYTGPHFLWKESDTWPVQREKFEVEENEMKPGTCAHVAGMMQKGATPDMKKFSSYHRLLRATAAVKAAARHWVAKTKRESSIPPWTKLKGELKNGLPKYSSDLAHADLEQAEVELIKLAQMEVYPNEVQALKQGEIVGTQSRLWKLSPTLDEEGIIRLKGRLDNANAEPGVKRPIILSARHYLTELIIDREHNRNAHTGLSTVLNALRRKFWIVEGRQAVKRSWTRCWCCRLKKVTPLIPEMGQLPHYRLESGQPAFTFTGTDYFGPIEVCVGRRREKRWVALFCCMVTRAVHMEVVHDMSTDETLMALCRFIDTRGRPRFIYSDNGTNYVGSANVLKNELEKVDWNAIQCNGRMYGITWSHIPPLASHIGGAWERLVGVVKKAMAGVLKEKCPRDTTLLTVVKAAEAIVNDRPLTYVSSDPNDEEALTPNHFIRGFSTVGPSVPVELDDSDEFRRAQWKKTQLWAQHFWERWTQEYLPMLVTRSKWFKDSEPLQVGDVVILVDNLQPRNVWKKGIIAKTFPGKDNQVRVVEVETVDGESKKRTTYRRPVSKVCPVGLRFGYGEDTISGTGMSGREEK